MGSLISQAQKAAFSSVFEDIHSTFERNIWIYRQANRVSISTSQEFNFAYRDSPQFQGFDFSTSVVSGIFGARIRWNDPAKEQNWKEIDPKIPGNICRLKLRPESLPFVSGASSIWVDGKPCEIIGNIRPHGLIDIQFYTIFVREKEMDKNG